MYNKYREQGFVVLAFPCNDFGGQDPKPESEIKEFVQKFNVKFPMFSKIHVNGEDEHAVYKYLKSFFPGDVTWNFGTKFVVGRNGMPYARYESESWETIEKDIVELLAVKPIGEKKE